MVWMAAAIVGSQVIGGMMQADAASQAANAQIASNQQSIAQQQAMFAQLQKNMQPYMAAGTPALAGMQDLLGLNGAGAQSTSIANLQSSPMFSALVKQGENSMLQNASATGGLRGGNLQAALAQFSPNMLNSLIQQQLGNYGNLVSLGQNASAGVGNSGMTMANNVSNALTASGAAQAAGIMGQSNAFSNALTGSAGSLMGMNYLGMLGGGSATPTPGYTYTPSGNMVGFYNPNSGAATMSDRRAKQNIVEVGHLPSGLKLYEFEYRPEHKHHGAGRIVGVMADEVESIFPEAIVMNDDGFKMVDYSKVH